MVPYNELFILVQRDTRCLQHGKFIVLHIYTYVEVRNRFYVYIDNAIFITQQDRRAQMLSPAHLSVIFTPHNPYRLLFLTMLFLASVHKHPNRRTPRFVWMSLGRRLS